MTIRSAEYASIRGNHEVKRIIIFDRNELSRAGFTSLINGDSQLVTAEADNRFMEMAAAVRRVRPDLIVVAGEDRLLDDLAGLTATPAAPPIAAFANQWDPESALSALRLGVRGLGETSGSRTMIMAAIHAVAAGGTYLAPSVAEGIIGAALVRAPLPDTATRAKLEALTERERRVLTSLAHGQTTADIAESLAVSSATVKSHISHMLQKLELRDRVQAVVFAYQSGLAGREACLSCA
jgi:DNA-binding NarL/FixJ family response regulator